MIKWLYRLLNHDKIDKLNEVIDNYRERNKQLEAEVREYKGYKLKLEVTKLYVEDDEALLELFEVAKKNERYDAANQRAFFNQGQSQLAASRQGIGYGLSAGAAAQGSRLY